MVKIDLLKGVVREMVQGDQSRVLMWRNNFDVRRFMYTQHEITVDEHKRWFDLALKDESRYPLIYEIDNISIGFIIFNQHGSSAVADWGFYLASNAPKASGYQLGLSALDYAFNNLKFHKVCGEVLAFNERSIHTHLKLGFKQEGVLREHYFDGTDYHDVVSFGLLDFEWIEKVKNYI